MVYCSAIIYPRAKGCEKKIQAKNSACDIFLRDYSISAKYKNKPIQ